MSSFKTVEVKAPWIPKTHGTLNIHDVIQMVKKKQKISYNQTFQSENDKTIFNIWSTLCTFIHENLLNKRNVNVREFGAFAFDIATENPQSLKHNSTTDRDTLKKLNKTSHSIRPCFIVGMKFRQGLLRYPGKEETIKPQSQHSIYQQGFNAVYCNYTPIATACQLSKTEVESILHAIFNSVYELVDAGRNVTLDFNFCHVYFQNKSLTYRFKDSAFGIDNFVKENYKDNLSSKIWTTDYQSSFKQSMTGSLNPKTDLGKLSDSIREKKLIYDNSFDLIKIKGVQYVK